jgi:hypothetical protein
MLLDDNETNEPAGNQQSQALTPEQIRKVADRVYQLLKQEARIDYERRRPPQIGRRYVQGGR